MSESNRESFNRLVYTITRQIPPGRVMTYGSIAALIPPPAGMDGHAYQRVRARWVGYAMAACPDGVPWQRVVNAQGKVSRPAAPGALAQRSLLEMEGIEFNTSGRLNLKDLLWTPQPSFIRQHKLVPPE
jgi:methylated-DNA-protein-cysteine methyltransferase-like protein